MSRYRILGGIAFLILAGLVCTILQTGWSLLLALGLMLVGIVLIVTSCR